MFRWITEYSFHIFAFSNCNLSSEAELVCSLGYNSSRVYKIGNEKKKKKPSADTRKGLPMGELQPNNTMAEVITTEEHGVDLPTIPEDVQTRYTNWKKNTKLLYDYLNTNSTKWPSLTCQFFPDLDTTNDQHRLLLSSFTSSQLPEDESIYVSRVSTLKHLPWSSLNNFDMDEMEFKLDNSSKLPSKNLIKELNISFPMGDCNGARYLPQNPDIIAAASSNGSIYVFDRTKHGSTRQKLHDGGSMFELEFQSSSLEEHQEVVSLAWNWQREGLLAACYSGGDVKVWDVKKYSRNFPVIDKADYTHKADPRGCNDVSWMVNHASILACCGESNSINVIDTRAQKGVLSSTKDTKHHSGGINSSQFNYHNDMLLCSGDSTGRVNLWDIRDLDTPLKSLDHGSSISKIQWNPNLSTILATADQSDGLVKLWDIAQEPGEELLFVHGGHMLGVNDISWNYHDPWLMCSVANDNSVQLWRPARNLVESR